MALGIEGAPNIESLSASEHSSLGAWRGRQADAISRAEGQAWALRHWQYLSTPDAYRRFSPLPVSVVPPPCSGDLGCNCGILHRTSQQGRSETARSTSVTTNLDLFEALQRAAESGEVVWIRYHGGSQPGALREVAPIKVTRREMRAFDVARDDQRVFLLERIELASAGDAGERFDVERAQYEPASLQEVAGAVVSELRAKGWHVEVNEHSIGLHDYFKNGKPRKTPAIELSVWDDGYSTRPYRVSSRDFAASRTFGNLSGAVKLFLEQAAEHAPSRR